MANGLTFKEPLMFSVDAGKKRTESHFKAELNTKYVEIKKIKPLKIAFPGKNQLFAQQYL